MIKFDQTYCSIAFCVGILQRSIRAYNVTVVIVCSVPSQYFVLRVTQPRHQHGAHTGCVEGPLPAAVRVTTFHAFLILSTISATVKMAPIIIIIIMCPRAQQSIASPTRFSLRYSIPFDKHSSASVAMRIFGTAIRAGSDSHMYAENGGRSFSLHLHVYTYGSLSRSSDLEDRLR